jgi:hypothetical protein
LISLFTASAITELPYSSLDQLRGNSTNPALFQTLLITTISGEDPKTLVFEQQSPAQASKSKELEYLLNPIALHQVQADEINSIAPSPTIVDNLSFVLDFYDKLSLLQGESRTKEQGSKRNFNVLRFLKFLDKQSVNEFKQRIMYSHYTTSTQDIIKNHTNDVVPLIYVADLQTTGRGDYITKTTTTTTSTMIKALKEGNGSRH